MSSRACHAPLRAVVVDPDAEVRAFLEETLPTRGHLVATFPSAESALSHLAEHRADLLVVEAASGSGTALVRALRHSPGGREAVILATTPWEDTRLLRALLEAGADDFVPRPIPPDLLLLRLETAERRARARERRQRAELVREVLLGISHATSQTASLPELLRLIHLEVSRLLDTRNFYVALHEGATWRFAYIVDQVDDVSTFTPEDLAKSATEWVRKNGRPLLLDEPTSRALAAAGEILPVGAPSVAWLGVPLATPRGVIGVAAVQSYDPGVVYGEDDLTLMQVVADDIAIAVERKRAEEALRESEERYARAAHAASDGHFEWDLGTGRVFYSARWKSAIGYRESQIGHGPEEWLDRIHPDDRAEVERRIAEHLAGRSPLFECDYRLAHRDGSWRYMSGRALASTSADGACRRLTGAQADVTAQRFFDPLTGLPNRMLLLDRLSRAAQRLRRMPTARFALLQMDLDRLQAVNHSLGRAAGDLLLTKVAERLRRVAGEGTTLARPGSDDFVLLVEDLPSTSAAVEIADRIHLALVEAFAIAGQELFVTASLGMVTEVEGRSAEELLRDAAIAVQGAKRRGRGETEIFEAGMRSGETERLRLEGDLRRAVERAELRCAFQPIVRLRDSGVVGYEALVRWNRPGIGSIAPPVFIPVAEEIGLAPALGDLVLRLAVTALSKLPLSAGSSPTVSVNVSPRQFARPELVDEVREALSEAGLPPERLKLEITEGTLMEGSKDAIELLRRFRALGIGIVVDDFGTGYSSLSYLPRLPLDALKIDQSFVRGMDEDREKLEVVRTIVQLARNLRLGVVAEGIETAGQASLLRGLDCELGQGYLFGRPAEPESFAGILDRPVNLTTGA